MKVRLYMSVINFNYTATTITQPFDSLSRILPDYICSLILSTRGNSSGPDHLVSFYPFLNGAPLGADNEQLHMTYTNGKD